MYRGEGSRQVTGLAGVGMEIDNLLDLDATHGISHAGVLGAKAPV